MDKITAARKSISIYDAIYVLDMCGNIKRFMKMY